ncbi:dnaJ homolog subfamily B member 13 [Musca vetustissima]|uniref:dnaJ homolog subfamily B member 13 n=1 Tax=Musca vetustissima TaxID=27455 RepID=UPI002AB6A000|nr:dnaJ homolog subfamily B member 13 [Musca vetustissima]
MNTFEVDYYNVLNVSRNATKEDILKSYRNLAIKLFPLRDAQNIRDVCGKDHENIFTHMSPLPLSRQWKYINMACDILGDDLRRSIYDRFGESGLLQGIYLPDGYFPPYQYHGNHMKVYHTIFGSYSPYSHIIDAIVSPTPPQFGKNANGIGSKIKDPPIFKQILVELEDVFNGCVKLMHVWREEFVDKNKFRTEKRRKTLTLSIPPGVTAGTRFCFYEEGDRAPTKIPADIIFIVEDMPHKHFKRINQHDIIYVHEINLCQALTGFQFIVQTLDKRDLKISISDVVYPGFLKRVIGEGLPKCNALDISGTAAPCNSVTKDYGNLIIEFKIIFPSYLTKEMKQLTRNYFAELSIKENEESSKNSTCYQK